MMWGYHYPYHFIVLLVFTLRFFAEKDHNAEDNDLGNDSDKRIESGEGVLDPEQDHLLVAVLVPLPALLDALPSQHSLAHVHLPVLGVGGADGQSGYGDPLLVHLLLHLGPLLQG